MQSSRKNLAPVIAGAIVTCLLVLSRPVVLQAQSCALCYQSAAASGAHFIQALKDGILILVFPPLLITVGISVLAYRKRNQCLPGWKARESATAQQQRGVQ
jgi:hypothetical protein